MRTFIENYLHFMKNCIRPLYEKLKSLKSAFIENSNFESNRDPCRVISDQKRGLGDLKTAIEERTEEDISIFFTLSSTLRISSYFLSVSPIPRKPVPRFQQHVSPFLIGAKTNMTEMKRMTVNREDSPN